MSTVSTLLRTVVCFRVCVWDSISNADGIAGGNALPHARVCVKQTTNLDTIEVRNTSCPCAREADSNFTICKFLFSPHARVCVHTCVGARGSRRPLPVCSWLCWSAGMRALIRHSGV